MKKFILIWLLLSVTLFCSSMAFAQITGGTGGPGDPNDPVGVIIVDKIAALQNPCEPAPGLPKSPGMTNRFCIQKTTVFSPPFDNSYSARIEKNGSVLDFVLLYTSYYGSLDVAIVNVKKGGEKKLFFEKVSDTQINCKYEIEEGAEVVFSLTSTINNVFQARIQIVYASSCFYGGCGSVLCSEKSPDPKDDLRSVENTPKSLASPNPFSQETQINYTLETPQPVSIQVFNAQGTLVQSLVQEQQQDAGDYTAILDGTNLANGVYFAVVQIGSTRKIHSLVKSN